MPHAHTHLNVDIADEDAVGSPGEGGEEGHDGEDKRHGLCAL